MVCAERMGDEHFGLCPACYAPAGSLKTCHSPSAMAIDTRAMSASYTLLTLRLRPETRCCVPLSGTKGVSSLGDVPDHLSRCTRRTAQSCSPLAPRRRASRLRSGISRIGDQPAVGGGKTGLCFPSPVCSTAEAGRVRTSETDYVTLLVPDLLGRFGRTDPGSTLREETSRLLGRPRPLRPPSRPGLADPRVLFASSLCLTTRLSDASSVREPVECRHCRARESARVDLRTLVRFGLRSLPLRL